MRSPSYTRFFRAGSCVDDNAIKPISFSAESGPAPSVLNPSPPLEVCGKAKPHHGSWIAQILFLCDSFSSLTLTEPGCTSLLETFTLGCLFALLSHSHWQIVYLNRTSRAPLYWYSPLAKTALLFTLALIFLRDYFNILLGLHSQISSLKGGGDFPFKLGSENCVYFYIFFQMATCLCYRKLPLWSFKRFINWVQIQQKLNWEKKQRADRNRERRKTQREKLTRNRPDHS